MAVLAPLVAAVSVWPQPASLTVGPGKVAINAAAFNIADKCPFMKPAYDRTLGAMFRYGVSSSSSGLAACDVNVSDVDTFTPQLGQDESYELTITATSCVIAAPNIFGLYHGLQTLVQLTSYDFDTDVYSLPVVSVKDKPAFPHRGLLVDSGRHFLPVPFITRLLDGMAMAKLNVLHWHLTEDQSWPIASRVHPEFVSQGAFSPRERYSIDNIKTVVKHAAALGIRVVPEFDMPGHTSSWRISHPELFTKNCQANSTRGALDPANPKVYEMISSLVRDWYDGVFSDSFVHLGTDEVPTNCWNNTDDIAFMRTHGIKDGDFNGLFAYFIKNLTSVATSVGRKPILWDEAFTNGAAPEMATIQIWHDASLLKQIVEAGHQAIFSPNGGYTNGWYLDGLKAPWEAMYKLSPMENVDSKYRHLVLGGEGCMWGETVDGSDLEFTIWPRLAAIAERLWTDPVSLDVDSVQPRLESFRCLLLELGHSAGPVGGAGRQAPPGPGSICSQTNSPAYSTLMV
jgi:hexosaminidase